MMRAEENYSQLIKKLDHFIRKYYLNRLVRGVIYGGAIIVSYFIIINLLEYFFFLSTTGRKILFYSFVGAGALVFYNFILLPVLHFARIGKVISYEQAAKILGTHFKEVSDRLTNILQLKQQASGSREHLLLMASIDQKIQQVSPVSFVSAIDLSENRKYLKYLLLPLFVLLAIYFYSSDIIKESSKRLLYNNTVFEKPAPFKFHLTNEKLTAVQFEDYVLELNIKGDILPQEVHLNIDGYAYKMTKDAPSVFKYTISNVQKDHQFYFTAGGFNSKGYHLHVIPKPLISGFSVALSYPKYTGKQNETLQNIGDLTIPAGTEAQWVFNTKNTEQVRMKFGENEPQWLSKQKNEFSFADRFLESSNYQIKVSGAELPEGDSVFYSVNVIPDQYPSIFVQEFRDSALNQYIYFSGDVSDDYGLSKLLLKYKIIPEGANDNDEGYMFENVTLNRGSRQSTFNHYWNLSKVDAPAGARLVYFLEVWDNDGVNGSKSTRSTHMLLEKPSENELQKLADKSSEQVKDQMASSLQKANELKKELENIKQKTIEKKQLEWEDKKAIEKVIEKQKSLENDLEQLQKEMNKNMSMQNENKNRSEDVMKKQQQLQKMMNDIMSDEMKQLFEKLESLLDQLNKKDLLESLDDFKFSEEQLEKELDRMLALFKALEFEQKMRDMADKMQKLAEEQKQLSEQTKDAKAEQKDDLLKQQQEINEKFEQAKKDMEQIKELGKEAEMPADFSKSDQQQQDISKDLNQSEQSLQQNQNKKASEKQKDASDKMQEMAEQLSAMMDDMEMEMMEEDMKALRQLLKNLITLSLEQEALMAEVLKVNTNDPKYITQIQQQKRIKDDTKMVEDSLFALSKRVLELQSFVNKEISELNKHMAKSLENLEERRKQLAGKDQQYIMTGFNNLALMLSEVMEQMQQQMASKMDGNQMCQKKGGGGGKPKPSLGQMQQQLNDKMDELQQQMKSGKMPGKGEMSKEMAEMAAKQAAIRDAVRKLMEEEGKKDKDGGKGLGGELQKLMDQMDKTETELANKKFTEELINRQKDIFTKLLEAEESIRKREWDDKRESHSAQDIQNQLPPSLEEYLKRRDSEIQNYKTVPPSLKPYYKQLVESYFKNMSF